jgi:hypothetical protein
LPSNGMSDGMSEGVVRTAMTGVGIGPGDRGMAAGGGVGAGTASAIGMAGGGTAGVTGCCIMGCGTIWMPDGVGVLTVGGGATGAGNLGGSGLSGFAAINPGTAVSSAP